MELKEEEAFFAFHYNFELFKFNSLSTQKDNNNYQIKIKILCLIHSYYFREMLKLHQL